MTLNTYQEAMDYVRKVGPTLSPRTSKMELHQFVVAVDPWLCNKLSQPAFAIAGYYHAYAKFLAEGHKQEVRDEILELLITILPLARQFKMTRIYALVTALNIWLLWPASADRKKHLMMGRRMCEVNAMVWQASRKDKALVAQLFTYLVGVA